jgi:hypothetical protein
MNEINILKLGKICKVNNCSKKHYGLGYCTKHYAQIEKHGVIKSKIVNKCSVPNCNLKYYGLGYCNKHLYHIKKHGKILERTIFTPNEFIIKENHAEIVLYDKKCEEVGRALIDLEDVEKCRKYKWHLSDTGYALRGTRLKLHHLIVDFKPVDHKNRNKLDNRKENLRKANKSQNMRNIYSHKDSVSKYKGVSLYGKNKRWRARIYVKNKEIHLGSFKDEKDAALAYNEAAKKYFGEFACLNEV